MENIFTGIDSEKPIGTVTGDITPDRSAFFAANIRELAAKGVRPQININTGGGGVFPGFDIIDAIITNELNTHVVGLAASMGGMMFMFGKRRTMNDFAMIMLHPAKGGKNQEVLDKMNANFRSILENTTEIPKNILDRIFISKKDVFFDARDAKVFKMVDEVIPTKVNIDDKIHELTNSQIDEDFHSSLELTNLCEIFNGAVSQLDSLDPSITAYPNIRLDDYTKEKNMSNEYIEVKAKLGLSSSDTERDIVKSIEAKDSVIGDLKADVELQKEEVERLNKEITSMNDTKATELVENAIESEKITSDSKESYLKFAKSDFEGCKNALDGIVAKPVTESIVDLLKAKGEDGITLTGDDAILARGYDDILANNPELLEELHDEKIELFNTLIDNRK